MKKSILFILIPLFACVSNRTVETKRDRLEEWKDARFGMFIHWGPVSLRGTEISWSRGREIPVEEYDSLYRQFNPVCFDAEEWVKIAREAGMKYMVFTSKHHDGFCMWDTEYTDYNIMNSPFGRDVLGELAAACRKYGMELGIYYSTCDWHHPDFPLTGQGGRVRRESSDLEKYTEYLKNQSGEILRKYGPLLVMWYDVPQEFDSVRGREVIEYIREIQPDLIVNNRTGARGDFDTPEQELGNYQEDRPWETCMTIGRQWAWKPGDVVKSTEQCLHGLIRAAGGNGNLLFNVGPGADGTIEPQQVERLKEMGRWLDRYGCTIYGTRGGPFKPTDWGVSTRKGNRIYVHILNWFGDSALIRLPDFGTEITGYRLVTGGGLIYTEEPGMHIFTVPRGSLKPVNTIIELELADPASRIAPLDVPSRALSFRKPVQASTNPNPRWNNAASVVNGDWVGHFWRPSEEDQKPWIEIDLGRLQDISRVIIYESGHSIKAFELQYPSGDEWVTFHTGDTIGEKTDIEVSGIATRKIRLLITGFSDPPGIYEMVVL